LVGTYAAVDDESRAQAFGERTRQRCWSAEADVTGYPVIVKSSAGGGGIGVNKCATPLELREAFDSIRYLVLSIFKDKRVFIEKSVENARHVKVQIAGDGDGLVKHLGERDCSLCDHPFANTSHWPIAPPLSKSQRLISMLRTQESAQVRAATSRFRNGL
jgi:urea carboxylase